MMQHRHHYMYWIAAYLLLPAVAAQNAGPGQGNWTRGKPEAHGLLTSTIIQTARALDMETPMKECFAVAKDGVLLYEMDYVVQSERVRGEAPAAYTSGSSSGDPPARKIEIDSAGKSQLLYIARGGARGR